MNNITIIDDDKFISKFVEDTINEEISNCDITSFYDGKNIEENLLNSNPTVIILDFYLPNQTALDLIPIIKNNQELKSIPILVITGSSSSINLKSQILLAGADAFITKPFQRPELIAQLKALLRIRETELKLLEKQEKLKTILNNQKDLIVQKEERWKLFLETTNDGIWEWDIINNEIKVSTQWIKLFGYKNINRIQDIYNIIHPEDVNRAEEEMQRYLRRQTTTYKMEFRIRDNRGIYKWQLCRGHAVWNENNVPYKMVGTQTDITDRKEMEVRLKVLAHHDALTGLPNRILVKDRAVVAIEQAKRENQIVGFFFLDLDGFKAVNDTFGHNAGDILLKQVSSRITAVLRKFDTLARIGGDEFLIISTNVTDATHLEHIAKRCLRAIAKPFIIENNNVQISTSIGVSYFPNYGDDFKTLRDKADVAMYFAKKNGKNKFVYYSDEFQGDITRNLFKKERVLTALANNEIQKVVQPIINLTSNEIIAFEALLRWFPKDGKPIMPHDFIHIAEEAGVMPKINEWLISYFAHILEEKECPTNIHINLLSSEFYDRAFLNLCQNFAEKLNHKTTTICFEITENTIMQNIEDSLRIIKTLKVLGYKACIDNFGTGYFSLQYLTELGIDYIKMDRYFVKNVQRDSKHMALWQAIIELGNKLNIETIAVGVENIQDVKAMRLMGINIMQGNHFGYPSSPQTFKGLCK